MKPRLTYFELDLSPGGNLHYWGIVRTREGHEFYIGPFKSRSTAYRKAKNHPFQGR